MRKLWCIFLAVLICAACIREQVPGQELDGTGSGEMKVTIPFTVAFEGAATPATKSVGLEDEVELENLYLAVFGSSGYLKEYVQADNLHRTTDYTYTFGEGEQAQEHTVTQYEFRVTLTVSESPRTIHFLGNGPSMLSFGYADDVLPTLLSDEGKGAYWQMKALDGIFAKKSTSEYTDSQGRQVFIGDYIDGNNDKVVNGIGYVPDQETIDALQHIPLVRNWAKISLRAEADSYFVPEKYAVVNVPARGAIVPYSSDGFVPNYQSYSFTELQNINYKANLPYGTPMDATIPTVADFQNCTGGVVDISDPDAAVYIFERPAPTVQMKPSCIIVYGHYEGNPEDDPGNAGDYYYKVDMMDGDQYYPVFRNIHYEVDIVKILSQGHHSPAAAFAAAGSADVSADINVRHLADISDGMARLQVSPWMAHTFTGAVNDGQLQVFFMDNVIAGHMDVVLDDVTVEALPIGNGEPDVITYLHQDDPIDDPASNEYGMRTIHFKTVPPGAVAHTQTIRITGHYPPDRRLYRDVVITVQPIQDMLVRFVYPRISRVKNTAQTVEIVIPDGLAESMFPLDFWIEPERMTLTPDANKTNNNLPVSGGDSISEDPDYAGKHTFHFQRNLTWDEYSTLATERDDDDRVWRVLPCHFKSNCDESATTVYVQNDYFHPAHNSFYTIKDLSFRNFRFTSTIKPEANTEVTVHFDVDEDPDLPGVLPEITMTAYQMEPESTEGMEEVENTPGTWRFTPESNSVDLVFYTNSDEGEQTLSLSADYYEPQTIRAHHFQDYGFVDGHAMWKAGGWSNVAYGRVNYDKNKNVLFGYYDDSEAPNATINIPDMNGQLRFKNPTSYPWTPTGPRSSNGNKYYHEIEFQTLADSYLSLTDPIAFTLCADGYVEVPVSAHTFQGNILTQEIKTSNVLKPDNTVGFTVDNPSFTMSQNGNSPQTFTVTFDHISSISSESPQGVILNAGDTYTINVQSDNPGYYIFYVQVNFRVNQTWNGTRRNLVPARWQVDNGTFYKYDGDNKQWVWNLEEQTQSATLTLWAAEDYPINITDIIVKTFNGTLH